MQIEPGFDDFAKTYATGTGQIVSLCLVGDLETPVAAMMKLTHKDGKTRENCFLLESVEGGAYRGRYSMIGLDPDLIFKVEDGVASIKANAHHEDATFSPVDGAPLDILTQLLADSALDIPAYLPPSSAGMFGYLGYDMVRHMESLGPPNPGGLDVPDAFIIRPQLIVAFDAVRDEIFVSTPVRPTDTISAKQAYESACERIESIVRALEKAPPLMNLEAKVEVETLSNTTPQEYRDMVDKAKEYIAAGDIFQVVLSQRFETEFDLPPLAFYRALRRTNPSPFLYFLEFGDFAIAGSSPEILVRVRDGEVNIRPIAGTRRRGKTPTEDKELAADLLSDEKELAEHLMLLDLGRNDMGRIAQVGSVKVTDKFFVEYYSHVMHIVSNVIGKLDKKFGLIEALKAGFPAGTVSGAPKVRAMEIIDELEKEKRGIYAGCVGYFGADGTMDTCIVLRTAIIKDGKLFAQAGAGIVADSVPQSELEECQNKARALFKAAEEAVRFASTSEFGQ